MSLVDRRTWLVLALGVSGCAYQIGTERPVAVSAKGYDGRYEVGALELRYHVPRSLIGPPYFTFAADKFNDTDLRIFDSSLRREAAGVSIGLSPYPAQLATTRDFSAYRDFYQHHAEERGLSARVIAEEISDIAWIRIEESYKNGFLARVIFVRPILSDYQLVCRIGLMDDLTPKVRFVRLEEWKPVIAELMSSFRFTETGPNQSPEPTVMSVTCRADARPAPAKTVAHL
jgi:hypothetical protein